MRLRLCILVLVLFPRIAFCWTSPKEGEPFGPVSAEELKMTSEPLAPGAPAIILYRQLDRDDSDIRGHEYNYKRIKILTEEGRKYADVEIPFLKGVTDITSIKARTVRPDGSIISYDGKVYDQSIVKAKGVKILAKTFTMPNVQIGSIIEYSYVENLPEYYLGNSRWILSDELFTKKAKFSLKSYGQYALRWSWNRLPPGTAAPKADPQKVVRLEVNNIPAFPTEDYMPPPNELKSRVDFTYGASNFERDVDKFWKDTGKRWNAALEDFIGKRKAMDEAVAQIVSPGDSPEVKLQKIYARVQRVRNTSFELEKSEQETKREKLKEINNVEDVWKRGYGNGSQLTWLFLALARAAGFEASGVWVADRYNYFFDPKSMDDRKLDSNVALVKLNGKDVYYDPGAAFTPFGLLPWYDTDAPGLRLDKNGGSWITTSLPDASESRTERKANLHINEGGDIEGELKMTFTGLNALQLRLDELHEDEASRRKYLQDLVKEQIPAAAEVELTNKPDWDSSSPTFVAEFKTKVPGWLSGAGRRAMLPTGIFTAQEKDVFTHAERLYPIYFEFPFSREDDITIAVPLGWEVASVPPPQTAAGGAVVYSFKGDKDGATLHLMRELRVNLLFLDSKFYPALRQFFQAVRASDEQQAVLQPNGSRAGK